MKAKIVRVLVEADGDMFFATSPDLKGLLVAATTLEKMDIAVSKAIHDLYLACGSDVVVSKADDGDDQFEPWVAFPAELVKAAIC
ncbi:hypothetical protein K9U39_13405 [Rhodoblastus acidophilus]|uniref:DUF1902 domain-containing protein n=1 Tax=Candidatus Rhodoblastus alkanivorans TaxID=2954117 RepID=A0ABS9ZDZ1_9HYPH|nr:hypothetical protein [Candidatus Rhodoblastus alkanivorans]MCI4677255.1 hypothetical protein [Candidatus Rhodoblastus alkanivorans]MCI4684607.1 hypothetical protein [Candidatus Rhodoblastus alkanivorans]MDI4641929.1 hypothetical protein [Rhodoblastus acidophilus]